MWVLILQEIECLMPLKYLLRTNKTWVILITKNRIQKYIIIIMFIVNSDNIDDYNCYL